MAEAHTIKALAIMEGLKGSPRGDAQAERRAEAFDRVLNLRKCNSAKHVVQAAERFANEFDDFPTPRQFADMVQSGMGRTSVVVDVVYVAEGGFTWATERDKAVYNCYTIHATEWDAWLEAERQPNVIFGNMTGGNKPKGNLGGFLD